MTRKRLKIQITMSVSKDQISKYRLRKITGSWRSIRADATWGLWSWNLEKKSCAGRKFALIFKGHILISKEVIFGVKFLNTSYGFLFIPLQNKSLKVLAYSRTPLIQIISGSLALIFIWKKPHLNFVITSILVNFYFTFQWLAATFLRLYLFTCNLFCFWNIFLVYYSWSPQWHLLI